MFGIKLAYNCTLLPHHTPTHIIRSNDITGKHAMSLYIYMRINSCKTPYKHCINMQQILFMFAPGYCLLKNRHFRIIWPYGRFKYAAIQPSGIYDYMCVQCVYRVNLAHMQFKCHGDHKSGNMSTTFIGWHAHPSSRASAAATAATSVKPPTHDSIGFSYMRVQLAVSSCIRRSVVSVPAFAYVTFYDQV